MFAERRRAMRERMRQERRLAKAAHHARQVEATAQAEAEAARVGGPFAELKRLAQERRILYGNPLAEAPGGPIAGTVPPPLESVPFASDAAQEAACEFGLTARDFAGRIPSGRSGFTMADIRLVRKGRNA